VTATGSAIGGDQGFTFAAVPGAGGVAGVLLAMPVARRRRRR
jgi:outer membrane lipoprotein SlyB